MRSLLAPRFKILHLRTMILGESSRGVFRLVNSTKLASALRALGLWNVYESVLERAGFGLHIFVIAERQ